MERTNIQYSFESTADYQKLNNTVHQIIKDDTGAEGWISTRSMPPTYSPPPVTNEALEKLKKLEGLNVG
ncbi:hypothetical protein PENFLA_c071G00038 [Penicillium flavigenum]|uniref:Uncharacterized protein n=1 Tax=Penicillium flavigenum TaxID=254877 RepID=A0A1V6SDN8_9EURO|nr:hypothetical protein PENFLA_c071G00038 [Penicillium flavigenum]